MFTPPTLSHTTIPLLCYSFFKFLSQYFAAFIARLFYQDWLVLHNTKKFLIYFSSFLDVKYLSKNLEDMKTKMSPVSPVSCKWFLRTPSALVFEYRWDKVSSNWYLSPEQGFKYGSVQDGCFWRLPSYYANFLVTMAGVIVIYCPQLILDKTNLKCTLKTISNPIF